MKQLIAKLGLMMLLISVGRVDGPVDTIPTKVRQIPPPVIKIAPADRERLEAGSCRASRSALPPG